MNGRMKYIIISAILHLVAGSAPATNGSSYSYGNVRFTVLTERLLRLEYSSTGVFDDRMTLTVVNRTLPLTTFDVEVQSGAVRLSTGALSLTYTGAPGPAQAPFTSGNLVITYTGADGSAQSWSPGVPLTPLNGTFTNLDCYSGPMACVSDWWSNRMSDTQSVLSKDGPVLIDDSAVGRLTPNGTADAQTLMPYPWYDNTTVAPTYQDWYFHTYMSNYSTFLGVWTSVSGRIAMPRRSALGVWWSRWYPYTQDSVFTDVLQGYADYDLPLSVLVLDTDWHETSELAPGCNTDGNLDFSSERFPNPQPFVDAVLGSGNPVRRPLELVLNVKPSGGVDSCDEKYPAIASAMGINPATNITVQCDLSNQTYVRAVYDTYYNVPPLSGVSTWWTDYVGCDKGMLANDALLWGNAVFDNEVRYNPIVNKRMRPQVLSRNGGLGTQRYPISFSGDTYQHEAVLDFLVQATPMANHALVPYWSHDVGGFMGQGPGAYTPAPGSPGDATPNNITGAVLLLRWFQFGALSPIMRTHCDHCVRTIWSFPDVYQYLKDAMLFRHALVPYLYTAARLAYDTGVPLLRPMHFGWPTREEAYAATRQYMLGPNLLVAPITTVSWAGNGGPSDNTTTRSVWLPPLQGSSVYSSPLWCPWVGSADCTPGDTVVTATAGLGDMPMFVQAGTVLPLAQANVSNVDVPSPDLLWVYWSPLRNLQNIRGEFYLSTRMQLYEDDGKSLDYEKKAGTRINAQSQLSFGKSSPNSGFLTFSVSTPLPPYPGLRNNRWQALQIRGMDPTTVTSISVAGVGVLTRISPPASIQSAPVQGWYVVPPALNSLLYPTGSIVVNIQPKQAKSETALTVAFSTGSPNSGNANPAIDAVTLGGGIGGGLILLVGLTAMGVAVVRARRRQKRGKAGWEVASRAAAATVQMAPVQRGARSASSVIADVEPVAM